MTEPSQTAMIPGAYDGGMRARSVLLYSVLRLLAFLVPFGLLMLLPIGREFSWLSALFAAMIGLSISLLFLRTPLDEISAGLAERREERKREASDEQVEDAATDDV